MQHRVKVVAEITRNCDVVRECRPEFDNNE